MIRILFVGLATALSLSPAFADVAGCRMGHWDAGALQLQHVDATSEDRQCRAIWQCETDMRNGCGGNGAEDARQWKEKRFCTRMFKTEAASDKAKSDNRCGK